jgi:hypothetical protein
MAHDRSSRLQSDESKEVFQSRLFIDFSLSGKVFRLSNKWRYNPKTHTASTIFAVISLATFNPWIARGLPAKGDALATELHPSTSRGFLPDRPKKQLKI